MGLFSASTALGQQPGGNQILHIWAFQQYWMDRLKDCVQNGSKSQVSAFNVSVQH